MSFWARPALLFGSVPGITPEVVRERGGHVRPERETCDALERFAFSGQRQCFQSLAAITAGDEEVHAHIDSLALKRSDDRTTEFTDRDRDKPVAQRLPAHMFVFAARHQMERQPVDGPQNIPDQSRGLGRGLASEAVWRVRPGEGTLYKPVREIPAGRRGDGFQEARSLILLEPRIVGNSRQLLGGRHMR